MVSPKSMSIVSNDEVFDRFSPLNQNYVVSQSFAEIVGVWHFWSENSFPWDHFDEREFEYLSVDNIELKTNLDPWDKSQLIWTNHLTRNISWITTFRYWWWIDFHCSRRKTEKKEFGCKDWLGTFTFWFVEHVASIDWTLVKFHSIDRHLFHRQDSIPFDSDWTISNQRIQRFIFYIPHFLPMNMMIKKSLGITIRCKG